jgi:Flp pilus assembly protein TadG
MLSDRRGTAAETLIYIAIFVILLFGSVQVGRAFAIKDALDSGVSFAARQLSLNPVAWTEAQASVRNEVDGNFLGAGLGSQITLTLMNSSGSTITSAQLAALSFGSEFRLRASLPLNVIVPLLLNQTRTIQVEHRMLVERYP